MDSVMETGGVKGCRLLPLFMTGHGRFADQARTVSWNTGNEILLGSVIYGQTGDKEETFKWFLVYHRDHILGTLASFLGLTTGLGSINPLSLLPPGGSPTAQAFSDLPWC